MDHKTEGLTRLCTAQDLFLITGGLRCGNCGAIELDAPLEAEWQRRQDEAAAKELNYTLAEITIYENLLGLPSSKASDYPTSADATRRLDNLRRQVQRPVDPEDVDETAGRAYTWEGKPL